MWQYQVQLVSVKEVIINIIDRPWLIMMPYVAQQTPEERSLRCHRGHCDSASHGFREGSLEVERKRHEQDAAAPLPTW